MRVAFRSLLSQPARRAGISMHSTSAPWTVAAQSAIVLDGEPGSGVWKSSSDDRSYRALRLPNGLRALLISDPRADTAAAALSCGVGHTSDPWDIAGLSHFLEHMVCVLLPPEFSAVCLLTPHSDPPHSSSLELPSIRTRRATSGT